jgi:hypothetical protein
MAEAELTVRSEGEEVVFGIPGGLDIRMSLVEAEEFEKQVQQAVTKATFHREARLVSWTVTGVKRSED